MVAATTKPAADAVFLPSTLSYQPGPGGHITTFMCLILTQPSPQMFHLVRRVFTESITKIFNRRDE